MLNVHGRPPFCQYTQTHTTKTCTCTEHSAYAHGLPMSHARSHQMKCTFVTKKRASAQFVQYNFRLLVSHLPSIYFLFSHYFLFALSLYHSLGIFLSLGFNSFSYCYRCWPVVFYLIVGICLKYCHSCSCFG